MRLALSIEIQEGMTYGQTLAMTRLGEQLGFDAALLAEHYYPSGPAAAYAGTFGDYVAADAWVYLAALARDTARIRLGTLVSPVTFRHPAVLAKLAATLDHVSDGRAELGLGAGWLQIEHDAYGLPFPAPGRRVDLVEENLQIVTGLWSEPSFSHAGRAYTLREVAFTPRPIQPRLPIIVGGSAAADRLPRLAARYADEYVINQPTLVEIAQTRAKLDAACAAIGRPPGDVRLSAFVAICVGDSAAEVEHLLDGYTRTNPQYVRMRARQATWIMGTPAEARAQLAALADAGIARAMLSVNCAEHLAMLPRLAQTGN